VDLSARVQTVDEAINPLFHALIKRFYEKTGCPVIINTSFNVRGEPIVCTPQDAYLCFEKTDMDYLVLGTHLLAKNGQKPGWHDTGIRQNHEISRSVSPVRDVLHELDALEKTPGALRGFGFLFSALFAIASAVLFWKGNLYWQPAGAASAAILLAGLLYPRTLLHLYRFWMALALALGWIMSRLLLMLAYFGIMTPIALVLKLLKKDVLDQRIKKDAVSYWKKHETGGHEGCKKQY
jgi:carbamoyltransferase